MSQSDIDKLDRLSSLLDSKYRIPGTSIRFGWDAILGIIPGAGDFLIAAPSAYLVYKAYSLGVRKRTLVRMGFNVGLDFFLGSIPLAGDVFDLFYKANRRNFAILRKELTDRSDEFPDSNPY